MKQRLTILSLAIAGTATYITFCLCCDTMPRCLLKWATGFDCPGCGSQRAVRSLLAGHPWEAWSYNLILPFILLYLLLILTLPLLPGENARRIYRSMTSAAAVWTLLAVTVAWWIVRNILDI